MKKAGVVFLIIAFVLWIIVPLYAIITEIEPASGYIVASFVLAIIGSILILIDVAYDRYLENKEDNENDDYRKY